MEIVHHHANGYLDWLFYENVFPLRESASIISGSGKGFTYEESFIVRSMGFGRVSSQ